MPPLYIPQSAAPHTLLTPSQPPPNWSLTPPREPDLGAFLEFGSREGCSFASWAGGEGGDRTRRYRCGTCGTGSRGGWEHQGIGPHLQEELPALGIIILLGENLAEAGEDSEAVPEGCKAATLRMGQAHPHASSQPSAPDRCPILPTWLLPQAARSLWMGLDCRADTTA